MADSTLPQKLGRLLTLLHDLPSTIPEGDEYYYPARYKIGSFERETSDGTDFGALDKRLESIFGPFVPALPICFLERGSGLDAVVDVFQDALGRKLSGDPAIVTRWVDRFIDSALAVYKVENIEPPAERRKSQPSKRAQLSDMGADDEPQAPPAKRKGTLASFLQPPPPKKLPHAPALASSQRKTSSGQGTANSAKKASKPVEPAPKKKKQDTSTAALVGNMDDVNESDDAEYAPPRQTQRSDDEMSVDDDDLEASAGATAGGAPSTAIDVDGLSDGESALRAVNAAEAKNDARRNRRGPENKNLKYWNAPAKVQDKKQLKWEFKCKFCSCIRTVPRSKTAAKFEDEVKLPSLSNLTSHISDRHKDAEALLAEQEGAAAPGVRGYSAAAAKLMGEWLAEGALHPKVIKTYRGFLRHFAAWIIDENLPFTTGESFSLKRLFKYMDIHYDLPSDTTVRNELARLYRDLHAVVVKELTRVTSRISYATDTWTTQQKIFTFAGTIASFINEDWELIERMIDMAPLEDNQHEGVHAGAAFVESAAGRGGANKIRIAAPIRILPLSNLEHMLAIAMDNASCNDVLARTVGALLLQRYGVHLPMENSRIRCLPHVVNIVVQKILSELDEADDPDVVDYFTVEKDAPMHFDPDTDPEQNDLEAADSAAQEEKDLAAAEAAAAREAKDGTSDPGEAAGRTALLKIIASLQAAKNTANSPVKKLRLICTKIVSTPQRRAKFRRHVAAAFPTNQTLHALMVVRDVATRWNFTHAMLQRALQLKQAIDTWAFEQREEIGEKNQLSTEEWEMLGHVESLLGIFPMVTLNMSQSAQPTLPWVLPMYTIMEEELLVRIGNAKLPQKLRDAASAGLTKLQRYFQLAKDNQYNWLATMLHPALRHWCSVNGYGEKAETIFKHVFDSYRLEHALAEPDTPTQIAPAPKTRLLDRVMSTSAAGASTSTPPVVQSVSEYQRYMEGFDAGFAMEDNALIWWKKNQRDLPVIARMARDFLAIPASSVSVERLFSASGGLTTKKRASLNATTIRESMCTKQWIRDGLMDRL